MRLFTEYGSLLVVLLGSFCSVIVHAETPWSDGFDIRLGYMNAESSTIFELSGPVRKGKIEVEDSLDMDETVLTARLRFAWRFNTRHEISIETYQLRRDGRTLVDKNFEFTTDEGTFVEVEAGAQLKSELNFDIYDVSYGYSFIQNEKHHLALTGGLYWMNIKLGLKGNANGHIKVDGVPLDPGDVDFGDSSKVGAPMPLLGMLYDYAIKPNWTVNFDARYFSVTIDPYSGAITNLDLSTRYFFDNFYLGGGYTWVNLNVDIDGDNWKGGIEWQFDGPRLFVGARF